MTWQEWIKQTDGLAKGLGGKWQQDREELNSLMSPDTKDTIASIPDPKFDAARDQWCASRLHTVPSARPLIVYVN